MKKYLGGNLERSSWTDEALVEALSQNDEHAFNTIYKRYWSKLYLSVYNILRDKRLSEDILQEIFLSLWDRRLRLAVLNLSSYLFSAARFKAFKILYKNRNTISLDHIEEIESLILGKNADENLLVSEISRKLEEGVNSLSKGCKEVYLYKRNHHLTTDQAADLLGLSPKTVQNHMTRALSQLRVVLKEFLALFL